MRRKTDIHAMWERVEADIQVHEEEDALGMWSPDAHKIGGLTALFSVCLFPLVAEKADQ
jgi:hypothetical protein